MKVEKEIHTTLPVPTGAEEHRMIETARYWRKDAFNKKEAAEKQIKEALVISSEKIEPYLKLVNEVVAHGRGKIVRPHIKGEAEVLAETALYWSPRHEASSGKAIRFGIDTGRQEIFWEKGQVDASGGKLKISLDYTTPDFEWKMQDLLLRIAGNPNNYRYKNITPQE